jgi:hypothetical protein
MEIPADNHLWAKAAEGSLPEGFDGWNLHDFEGWTLAHEAARRGKLPEGFSRWELADREGWTVRDEAEVYEARRRENDGRQG